MADSRTCGLLARRRWGKRLGAGFAGIVLGLALKAAFGIQLVGSFFDQFQLVGEILPGVKLWLDARPAFTGWIAGPIMLGLPFWLSPACRDDGQRSTHSAIPIPPPMHKVARPFFASRRPIS